MKENILHTALVLLTTRGVHHFTMDELAQRLAVSKKTLYRFYSTKQSLIAQACDRLSQQIEDELSTVPEKQENQLDILLRYINSVTSFIKSINPEFFSDLRKHYPDLWQSAMGRIYKSVGERVQKVLESGISEGIFRGNLHPGLVVDLWQQHTQCDFQYAAYLANDYSKDEVFRQGMNLFLYGIISPSAIGQLENALQQQVLKTSLPGFHQTHFS